MLRRRAIHAVFALGLLCTQVAALPRSPVPCSHSEEPRRGAVGFPGGDNPPGPTLPPPRPLVLWHGLGDSHSSAGMLEFMSLIADIHPNIFIHSVYIEKDLGADQKAGFIGNLHDQLALVNDQLNEIPELRDGFDALGFSQGGQFLRAYVEWYNDPPVYNLITFGSQHMGVSDLPLCKPRDWLCWMARRAAQGNVYSNWAQENVVQAQYFRDQKRLGIYLSSNRFLTSINNEIPFSRNETFKQNLVSLDNLVLVAFDKDRTVVPKESSWFGSYAPPDPDQDPDTRDEYEIIPMQQQPLYIEDWIGLRELDERGSVKLLSCDGEHMQLPRECWEPIVKEYVGATEWKARSTPGLVIQN